MNKGLTAFDFFVIMGLLRFSSLHIIFPIWIWIVIIIFSVLEAIKYNKYN